MGFSLINQPFWGNYPHDYGTPPSQHWPPSQENKSTVIRRFGVGLVIDSVGGLVLTDRYTVPRCSAAGLAVPLGVRCVAPSFTCGSRAPSCGDCPCCELGHTHISCIYVYIYICDICI